MSQCVRPCSQAISQQRLAQQTPSARSNPFACRLHKKPGSGGPEPGFCQPLGGGLMPVDGRQELSNGTEIQPAIGSCVPNCIGFGRCPFLFLLSMEFRVVEMN